MGMKIGVITLCIGKKYQKKWKTSIITKKIYCERNGYDFIYIDRILDTFRKPHWSKILALQTYLNKYDWIFYSDADTHIMNLDFKLENIIKKYRFNNFLIITKDRNMINSGNFFI